MIPTAEVTKPASDDKREIYFWAHRADAKGGGYEDCNFSTHVTKFTPLWCAKHEWAYDKRCLACETEEKRKCRSKT